MTVVMTEEMSFDDCIYNRVPRTAGRNTRKIQQLRVKVVVACTALKMAKL